ncbi:unnamed protein product [Didymodactylos carnosus]|uniref:Uncharacterized protein n=1 Tax=Didymodactylos carnosus TaxID=1234261 RepID=A0A815B881_9BILA|nr:unnamed protein product [Didymodactylos carnosus]CAF1376125.1 unnamed protein product [Didymodactylos carnosus]CAF4057650.1 unnamed protein product [Didymodactylos carnosus]CAF4184860.1 unnamed protein product [Didymodactylos carnosus]
MVLDGENRVMLSYQHGSITAVKAVYNMLMAANIPVWFDKQDLKGDIYDGNYPHGKQYSPIDVVKEEHLPFSDVSEEEQSLFKEYSDKGQILWVLDGYDEFFQNMPEHLQKVFDHIRETQHHILTSRPYAIALLYDVKLEITGFTNDNITEYVEDFFDQIKDETSIASPEGNKLLRYLESHPIFEVFP